MVPDDRSASGQFGGRLVVGLGFAAVAVAGIGSLVRADRPLGSAADSAAGHAVVFQEPALVVVAAPAAYG